jgi:hypothetical protein
VQELVDIEIGDLYLSDKTGMISEPFVTLRGKGGKLRNVNLSTKAGCARNPKRLSGDCQVAAE